jgi:DNA-binding MarR family transcriptional regulator
MTHLMRRRSELGGSLHPELSLVGYTFLAEIRAVPGIRATDLAALFGLEKSTVSRQLNELERAGLLGREGERPGRRGHALAVTAAGTAALARESDLIRRRLSDDLAEWGVEEITSLADMLDRFIVDMR